MKVCYFGTWRANYSRNQIMIEGLRRSGVEVVECHAQLWQGIEDRVQTASGGWLNPSFVWRVIRTYGQLLRAYRHVDDYDVMMVGYPGQLDVYLARILTWLRHKSLVMDVFMSLYLVASERELVARHPLTGRLLHFIERWAYRLPDKLVQDTAAYVDWFTQTFGLAPERFCLVPTGADDRVFYPHEVDAHKDDDFHLVYYGTFIPNHGVDTIVEAARILREHTHIHFELIGEGPTQAQAMALAKKYGLTNIIFAGWVDKDRLPIKVAQADVCLGVFGTTPQSLMTVQNKLYEALAMRKPLITAESPTVRAALTDGEHVVLCQRQNADSLADAILRLASDPDLCDRLAQQGYAHYRQNFTTAALGQVMRAHLHALN